MTTAQARRERRALHLASLFAVAAVPRTRRTLSLGPTTPHWAPCGRPTQRSVTNRPVRGQGFERKESVPKHLAGPLPSRRRLCYRGNRRGYSYALRVRPMDRPGSPAKRLGNRTHKVTEGDK